MKSAPQETAEEVPQENQTTGVTEVARYSAMSARTLAILAVSAVLGIALLAGIKQEQIGDFIHFSISSSEAATRADQVLRDNKFDPAAYHRATTVTYTFDEYTNEYLRRALGIAAVNRIYKEQVPSAFWTIRYFQDSQAQEFMVVLHPDGSFHSLHHTLDERTPGDNLTKEETLARATNYLRDVKHVADMAAWRVVDTETEKRPAEARHHIRL